jgi:predicted PurR-regulated permease PerM
MAMEKNQVSNKTYTVPQIIWLTGGIFALITLAILLFIKIFSVLLLVLAGVLIAAYFLGLAGLIERKLKLSRGLSLVISIVGTIIFAVLLFWLIGAKVESQVNALSEKLPSTIQHAEESLNKTSLGRKIVQNITSEESRKKAETVAKTSFQSTFGVLGDIYVVLFLGIFFTAGADLYKKGIITLVPKGGQRKAREVLAALSTAITKWLKGMVFAMFIVFILTAIGLAIIGVPMWLALAVIAGLLNFIPNFGPLIAMVPAVLVAFTQSPTTAAIVAGLYIVVQVLESNLITPKIQQRLVDIPPALIIIAQLVMGVLIGGWGLVLATPLMLIFLVLVKQLYVKEKA